jgi:hypothetical protein
VKTFAIVIRRKWKQPVAVFDGDNALEDAADYVGFLAGQAAINKTRNIEDETHYIKLVEMAL